MEKIQEKASKLLKRQTRQQKTNHLEKFKAQFETSSSLQYLSCMYCTKVFSNASYLVSHVLRRHSEQLVLLHRKISKLNKPERESYSNSINLLANYLEKEFEVIKNKLNMFIPNASKSKFDLPAEEKRNEIQIVDCDKFQSDQNTNDISEFQLKCVENETAIHNLEGKFEELHGIMKSLQTHNSLLEENIMKKLSEELFKIRQDLYAFKLDLEGSVETQLKHQQLDWKNQFSEHKIECQEEKNGLENFIRYQVEKINSSNNLQEIEKKFEKQIQYFITKPNKLKKHTLKEYPASTSMTGALSLVVAPKSPPKQREAITLPENLLLKETKPKLHCPKNLIKSAFKENSILIDEKLKTYNVFSKSGRTSNGEYENKLRLVENEKQNLAAKDSNFLDCRNQLNSLADKMAMCKLKSKRVSFCNLKDNVGNSITKQCSAGFILSNEDSNIVVQEETTGRLSNDLSGSLESLSSWDGDEFPIKS